MALELSGKVYRVGTEITGEGRNGTWKKIDFMIEYLDGQYPKKAAFSAWADKIEAVKRLNVGEDVTVSFNVDSREYNDKFFTDLRIWRIQSSGNTNNAPMQPAPMESNAPMESMNMNTSTNQVSGAMANGQDDDLPF